MNTTDSLSRSRRRFWLLFASTLAVTVVFCLLPRLLFADDAAAKPEKETQGDVAWFVEACGVIGLFILGLWVYLGSIAIQLFMQFRPQIAMPPDIVANCDGMLEAKDFKGIYEQVKADDSFFSRVLNTGISELPGGLAEARDAMERFGESIIVGMEKKISILAVLGTLGPMIGLLGTLKGMISSFKVIAQGKSTLDPSEVAKGISEALVLTLLGVALSVPAIWLYSLFKNRVSSISTGVMLRADEFLRHFAHAARKGAPASGRSAPPAAPARA